MKTTLLYYGALTCILTSSALSCTVATTQNDQPKTASAIIFLNYTIKKDNGKVSVALINQKVTVGTVKDVGKAVFQMGDLKCIALNAKKQSLQSTYIPNPLHKSVEYEDEHGRLARKEVQLDSAHFSVRMQLPAKTKFIAIERMDTAGNSTLLTTEIN